jgi:hypothetical protein
MLLSICLVLILIALFVVGCGPSALPALFDSRELSLSMSPELAAQGFVKL